MNSSGEVTGTTYDTTGNIVADFVRAVDGSITTFSPTEGSSITVPFAINNAGRIVGYHTNPQGISHGFLRQPNGSITTFEAPGATLIFPESINSAGAIAGYYQANSNPHGFLLTP
jgi:probable HAF family extracellular repeat protein